MRCCELSGLRVVDVGSATFHAAEVDGAGIEHSAFFPTIEETDGAAHGRGGGGHVETEHPGIGIVVNALLAANVASDSHHRESPRRSCRIPWDAKAVTGGH